ncbi:Nn.00g058520.m01.CDS01 [Neocucurbitaria sp. VM-36]
MKERMRVSKSLYQSRHYTQCAKFNERLLSEVHDEIHPLHLAYLNFYTALSHDTLAREATLKNRYKELSLAEKHYSAAISVLKSSSLQKPEDEQLSSPVSTTFNEDQIWRRRSSNAGSFDSTASAASSATSYSPEIHDFIPELTPKRLARSQVPKSFQELRSDITTFPKLLKRNNGNDAPLLARPQTPQEYQFAADTSAFVRMLEAHLASVKLLKEKTGVPAVRFTFPSPPTSPTLSKPRNSHLFDEESAEIVRQRRRTVRFRPRFDPTSVRLLCSEALAELS